MSNRGNTLEKFKNKFGEEIGVIKWQQYKSKIGNSLQKYKIRYGQQLGIKKWNEYKDKISKSNKNKHGSLRQKWSRKYSPEQVQKKYNNWRQGCSCSKQGFIRRHGQKQGIKKFEQFKQKSMQTKQNFIKRYGEQKGIQLYNQKNLKIKLSSKRSVLYWMQITKGDYELAISLLKQEQKRSLDFFIKKYGHEDGNVIYKQKIEKQKASIIEKWKDNDYKQFHKIKTKEYFDNLTKQQKIQKYSIKNKYIKKYGEKNGLEKFQNIYIQRSLHINQFLQYSKVSIDAIQILIQELVSKYGSEITNIYYKDKQFFIIYNNRLYFYDFYCKIKEKAVIVQFQGDFWHANPNIYTQQFVHPISGLSAKQIWEKDFQKREIALQKVEVYLCIWQKQYKENKCNTINNILNIIQENINGKNKD